MSGSNQLVKTAQKNCTDWYCRLISSAAAYKPMLTAVVHPTDAPSLNGAIESAKAGLIIPVLVGPKDKILAAAKESNIDISKYEIVETKHSVNSAEKAVELANNGKVAALMKGKIHTEELLHEVVKKDRGLRTGRRISHVFAMEVPYYHKPLFVTDAVVNIFPDLAAKKDITQNAIDLFVGLGLGVPKVAIVSATENVDSQIPSTLDATALCKMADRNQITGGIIDGPLAFDLAISPESAKIKDFVSPVAGDADIIVVPDLESGNMLYKQMVFLSGAESAGIILGAKVPIILTSRSDDVTSRMASCAMAVLYLQQRKLQ